MSLGDKYLARKRKLNAQVIQSEINLGNVGDMLTPMLHTLNLLKPKDEVVSIEFDWHNIKGDMCPIKIYIRKEASKTKND